MIRTVTVTTTATFDLPLDQIIDAVGPEVTRALNADAEKQIKLRTEAKDLMTAVRRVVSALNYLEVVTNTTAERAARDTLMRSLRDLRAANIKQRNK